MAHRPPIRHPNPFRPARDELEALHAGHPPRSRWRAVLKIAVLIGLGLAIVALHVLGIVGIGLHAGAG